MDRTSLIVTELPPLLVDDADRPRVAGASGVVRVGSWLHVVSDDEQHVFSWRVPIEGPAHVTPYGSAELPREPAARKAAKSDIEALTVLRDADARLLVGFGSGSTERRRGGFSVTLDDDGSIRGEARAFDAGALYDRFQAGDVPPNVEGATQFGDEVVLLLRSSTGDNRVARLDGAVVRAGIAAGVITGDALVDVVSCELGTLHGVHLGFTDATTVDDQVWFTAAAEDTANAYDDGPVAGSVIGRLAADGLDVADMWELDLPGEKVEGITPIDTDDGSTRFWLVTDSDDESRSSLLLECVVPDS